MTNQRLANFAQVDEVDTKGCERMAELKARFEFNPWRGNPDFECALAVGNAEALKTLEQKMSSLS